MPDLIPQFSLEQLARQSRLNASATILATLAFLKQRQLAGLDWVNFMGTTFAASWEAVREEGPPKALELIALDMVSIGASIVSFNVNPDCSEAQAIFGNWPEPSWLPLFNLSMPEVLDFMQIFAILAKHINLEYSAQLEPKAGSEGAEQWQIKVKVWQA